MQFRVKTLTPLHAVATQAIDAIDEADARRQLGLQGLRVISAVPMARRRWLAREPKLPLVIFSQELIALLEAGFSLVEAIETLTEKESNASLRRPLERILGRLYEGQTLAAALAEHSQTFPPLYVSTVRASERTGALRESLSRYVAYHQQIDALRSTLINAAIYPAVLLGAGLLVMLFLLGYVVPRFSTIYAELGSDLPLASRLLMNWGQLLHDHPLLIAAAGAAALGGGVYSLTRPAARLAIGAWAERLPTVGEQLRIYQLARMYRTFGMLLRGGVPAVTALQMSSGLLGESLRRQFTEAIQKVREGQSIALALERHGLTTPVATRMLRVGERSGNMGEMTERIASFYDEALARWVAILTRLIEPVMMTIIGLVIGGIVMLMYFPIFQLASSIQ